MIIQFTDGVVKDVSMKDFQTDKILASLKIRCQVCNEQMRRYRQDEKVYYHCDNCQPNRVVWIDMPDYIG